MFSSKEFSNSDGPGLQPNSKRNRSSFPSLIVSVLSYIKPSSTGPGSAGWLGSMGGLEEGAVVG